MEIEPLPLLEMGGTGYCGVPLVYVQDLVHVHTFMHFHMHVHTCTYMYIDIHMYMYLYTQSQGLESAAMKDKGQNEPMFKVIEFAPTLTEGGAL